MSFWPPEANIFESFALGNAPYSTSNRNVIQCSMHNADVRDRRMQVGRHPILAFVTLTFGISWSAWALLYSGQFEAYSTPWTVLYLIGASGPSLAAFIVQWLCYGKDGVLALVGKLVRWRVNPWIYLAALTIPPATLALAVFGYGWWVGVPVTLALSLTVLPIVFLRTAMLGGPMNEEFGWRGVLLPELLRSHSPFVSSLWVWPLWACWHLPLWVVPGAPHKNWPFGVYFFLAGAATFILTWLHLRARGRLLLPVLFHTAVNVSILYIPLFAAGAGNNTPFVLWVLLLCAIAIVPMIAHPARWFMPPAGLRTEERAPLHWPFPTRAKKI